VRSGTVSGAFARFVRGADDRTLERLLANGPMLRILFGAVARRFDPSRSGGFAGELQCDLRSSAGELRSYTIVVEGPRARARRGPADDPALVATVAAADLVRMAAGELDTGRALLTGRLDVRGDFRLMMRLGGMFGGGS
jgi:putative sterol carrier protein